MTSPRLTALFLAVLGGASTACRAPPWHLRPATPSAVESFYGTAREFRVCVPDDGRELVAAKVTTTAGTTTGVIDERQSPRRCAHFEPAEGARSLDTPASVTLETRRGAEPARSERAPLAGADVRWVPHLPLDVSSRVEFQAPLKSGYSDLLELHSALRYRLAPALRLGAGIDARFGARTLLLGTGAVLSTGFPLASRWVTTFDAEYGVAVAAYGRENWDGQWAHGPSAHLAVGYTAPAFLGSPSVLDGSSIGPLASVEYLFLPNQHTTLLVVGGGLYFRSGF